MKERGALSCVHLHATLRRHDWKGICNLNHWHTHLGDWHVPIKLAYNDACIFVDDCVASIVFHLSPGMEVLSPLLLVGVCNRGPLLSD